MFVYWATCPCNRPRPGPGSTPREEFLTDCLRRAFPVSRREPAFVVMGSGQCTRRPRSLSQQIQTLPGSVVARLPLSVQAVGCTGHFRVCWLTWLPAQDERGEGGQREGNRRGPAVQDDKPEAERRRRLALVPPLRLRGAGVRCEPGQAQAHRRRHQT